MVYCDKGSEFDSKLFNDKMKLGFGVQFTIDKQKAVYAERAIRMIRRGLEQYYAGKPNARPSEYVNAIWKIVTSHNNAPSNRVPKLKDGLNALPHGTTLLVSKMEKILRKRQLNQYDKNISKKVIQKRLKFKKGNIVRYYLIKGKFAKESNLSGSW